MTLVAKHNDEQFSEYPWVCEYPGGRAYGMTAESAVQLAEVMVRFTSKLGILGTKEVK